MLPCEKRYLEAHSPDGKLVSHLENKTGWPFLREYMRRHQVYIYGGSVLLVPLNSGEEKC